MTQNGMIEQKSQKGPMTLFYLNLQAFFEIHGLKNIYKPPNKILGEMSLVPGRLALLSLQKCSPQTTVEGLLLFLHQRLLPQPWEITLQGLLLGAFHKVRK